MASNCNTQLTLAILPTTSSTSSHLFTSASASASAASTSTITTATPNNQSHKNYTSCSNSSGGSSNNNNNDNNRNRKLNECRPITSSKSNKLPVPNPSPRGWFEAHSRMNGTPPVLFCDKPLTNSDVNPHQNRLLLPKKTTVDILLNFLTQGEREKLKISGSEGIQADMIDSMGRVWVTRLNCWKSNSYNLSGNWFRLIDTNGLSCEDHAVSVSVFRHGPENKHLGFVVLVRPKTEKEKKSMVAVHE